MISKVWMVRLEHKKRWNDHVTYHLLSRNAENAGRRALSMIRKEMKGLGGTDYFVTNIGLETDLDGIK